MNGFRLRDRVMVRTEKTQGGEVYKSAIIVGRTFQENPHYDVEFPNGQREQNIPEDCIAALPI